MKTRIARLAVLVVAATLLVTSLGTAASASGTTAGHPAASPAGCRVIFQPRVNSPAGRVCLDAGGGSVATGSADPTFTGSAFCTVEVYGNGPFGSAAWQNGWALCVTFGGNWQVPVALNDQASSWESCDSGTFYVNQPGTTPNANYPAFTAGNFPWGAVPNDTLSSGHVNGSDLCLMP